MEEIHKEMRINDREYFQTKLNNIMNTAPIELRSDFNQSLTTIFNLNISSYDMLLNTLQNSQTAGRGPAPQVPIEEAGGEICLY